MFDTDDDGNVSDSILSSIPPHLVSLCVFVSFLLTKIPLCINMRSHAILCKCIIDVCVCLTQAHDTSPNFDGIVDETIQIDDSFDSDVTTTAVRVARRTSGKKYCTLDVVHVSKKRKKVTKPLLPQ